MARASEILNRAALIASDVGASDLARDLCWRHYDLFANTKDLTPDIAALALQPIMNVLRQQIRDGYG